MKKTDIAMIILIASVGMFVSYLLVTNISFIKVPEEGVEVQTMQAIGADVPDPDKRVFNSNAINPTVEVIVGNGEN
jgi:hypothetical protein